MPTLQSTAAYEFVIREFRYHINANWCLDYTKHIRLRAGHDGLRGFADRILWTGGDTGLPECTSEVDCKVRPMLNSHGAWDHFQVDFDDPLRAGQEIEFELSWQGLTNWPNARPFLSTSTDEPTRQIRFDLRIPGELRLDDRATFEMLRSASALEPSHVERLTFDDSGHLFRQIDGPEPNCHFRINWQWSPSIAGSRLLSPGSAELRGSR